MVAPTASSNLDVVGIGGLLLIAHYWIALRFAGSPLVLSTRWSRKGLVYYTIGLNFFIAEWGVQLISDIPAIFQRRNFWPRNEAVLIACYPCKFSHRLSPANTCRAHEAPRESRDIEYLQTSCQSHYALASGCRSFRMRSCLVSTAGIVQVRLCHFRGRMDGLAHTSGGSNI